MKEEISFTGWVEVEDAKTGVILARMHNIVTEQLRQEVAQWLVGGSAVYPSHIAIGLTGKAQNENPAFLTAMKSELERVALSSASRSSPETARFAAVFGPGTGTATGFYASTPTIREFGLFNANVIAVTLDNCDAVGTWTTSGGDTITLEPTNYMEGTGAITKTGTGGAPTFQQNMNIAMISGITEATARLQFWYYVDDVDNLTTDLTVRLYTDGAYTKYYQWTWLKTALGDGWNWFDKTTASATETLNPNLAFGGDNARRFYIAGTKVGGGATEKLDKVRVIAENGDLLAWAEPPQPITKDLGQATVVYWFVSSIKGGSTMSYVTFAKEELLVVATDPAVGLSSPVYAPSGTTPAQRAEILVLTNPIRWYKNGTAPTATTGWSTATNGTITLESATDITQFKVYSAAGSTLVVHYLH